MPYLLIPPSVAEGPAGGGPLFFRYKLLRGISLLVSPEGAVSAVRYPSEDQLAAAAVAYIGGHEYLLSDEDAAVISAGGYADCLHSPLQADLDRMS